MRGYENRAGRGGRETRIEQENRVGIRKRTRLENRIAQGERLGEKESSWVWSRWSVRD